MAGLGETNKISQILKDGKSLFGKQYCTNFEQEIRNLIDKQQMLKIKKSTQEKKFERKTGNCKIESNI